MMKEENIPVEADETSLPVDMADREEAIIATLSLEEANRFMEDKTHIQVLCDPKGHPSDPVLENLLRDVMNIAFAIVQPERAYVLLYDASGELKPKLIQRRSVEGKGNGVSISQTIIQKVLEDKAAVLSLDARSDPRFNKSESVQLHGIRSVMCVPLMYHNEMMGILHVDRRLSEKAFTQTDLVVLTSVANLLAVALAKHSSRV